MTQSNLHKSISWRDGQSLIELLIAISIGSILIIAAVSVIVPALLINQQVTPVQTGASLGAELLNNVRAWSERDWHNVLALATGTANPYYLNTAQSPFFSIAAIVSASSTAWPNGYGYRRVIAMNHLQVSNTDQTSFPVLISGAYNFLAASSSGGLVQNGNGYDILFTSDVNGASPIPFEIESYASSSGALVAWVKVATLSASVDTPIYLFYGNPSVGSSPANPTAVWDTDYKGVWHLNNPASPGDSTSNANTGVNHSTAAIAGQIGKGSNMASGNYISVATSTGLNFGAGAFSFEMWFNASSLGQFNSLGGNGSYAGAWNGYQFAFDSIHGVTNGVTWYSPGYSYPGTVAITDASVTTGVWHHLAGTRDVSGNMSVYLDGHKSIYTFVNAGSVNSGNEIRFGENPDGTFPRPFNGSEDEIRISDIARSADWIKTEYNNQWNPAGFYTVGGAINGLGSSSNGNGMESIVPNPVASGLIGWWKFDEGIGTTAIDSSGNGNNGILSGTTIPTWTPGMLGAGALSFDGVNAKVTLSSSASFNTMTSSFTISHWIKTAAATGQMYTVANAGGSNGYRFGLGGGKVAFLVGNAGGFTENTCGSRTVNDGVWHMIAGVFNLAGPNQFDCYIDGVYQASVSLPSSYAGMATSAPGIGKPPCCQPLNGSLDDVRIYNRALSAAEISQIYNTTAAYNRYFYLSDVYRAAGAIVTSGGTYDPSTKLVTVIYQLPSGATSSLSAYLTRHGQGIYDQTDWSGGGGANGPATTTNNQFATSSGVNFSTTTGSMYVAIPGY